MDPAPALIAVVGCQRSGTSLTGQILGAHPAAVLIDEDDGLYPWIRAWAAGRADALTLYDDVIAKARLKYAPRTGKFEHEPDGRWRLAPHVSRLVLKAPNLTFDWDLLKGLPTPVSVVYPVRDPRAVVASMARMVRRAIPEKQAGLLRANPALAADLADALQVIEDPEAPHLVRLAEVWRVKSSLADRFAGAGLPTFRFRYEDLIADKEDVCRRLAEATGLGFAPELLAHERAYTDVGQGLTLRFRPVDSFSVRRWEDALNDDDVRAVMGVAGQTAARLGYVGGAPAPRPRRDPAIGDDDLAAPIILAGRGGSGTRLISELARAADIHLGERITKSGDSLDWLNLIYEMAVDRLTSERDGAAAFEVRWRAPLLGRAREVLSGESWRPGRPWGWKLPENSIVAGALTSAFTRSRLVHLVRHPLSSAFRRTHVTSRGSNPVGRAMLHRAYLAAGRDPALTDEDPPHLHNALTWLFQVREVMTVGRERLGPDRYLELRFEDLCRDPEAAARLFGAFCGGPAPVAAPRIDARRAAMGEPDHAEVGRIWDLCAETAGALGYGRDDWRLA